MNRLWKYIYLRRFFYFFTLLFIAIYYIILSLYNNIDDAIMYATILCLSFLFIFFIVDYSLFYRKSKRLDYLLSLKAVLCNDLPKSSSPIEQQYQALLNKLDNLHKELEDKNERDYYDSINYFTLWVHQIKTPISALRLLIQSVDCSKQEQLIQVLRVEQYVDMALQYIKIDHMESDLKIKKYSLLKIINDVIKKQATFFIQGKIKVDVKAEDLNILTDEKWISFVLEQIISNALKYTKSGTISIYTKDETLYIEDTGIGIKQEDLSRVFERGFTGYNGRIDKKASGLGLYLCKRIIDNLGYKINIKSQLNQGTIVSIDFHVDKLYVE